MNLHNGDCLEILKTLEDESIDSIVTDPPYGLAFMGKKWDYDVPSMDIWKECLRVLKPGGHLLSFGGTRTYHRMVVAIEDAGFEIRDQIQWLYGSGFPKSMDISKAIDKQAGISRDVLGFDGRTSMGVEGEGAKHGKYNTEWKITAPATDSAKQWQGWGTALKPANEPICLARKPISEKTVASNVLKYGTGAMNIDECRVGMQEATTYTAPDITGNSFNSDVSKRERKVISVPAQGRWPANVILDEEAAEMFPVTKTNAGGKSTFGGAFGNGKETSRVCAEKSEIGLASRFFYCAKASKSERNAGLDELEDKVLARSCSAIAGNEHEGSGFNKIHSMKNHHPTVKPIKLMEYLCKLITPPNGVVLDPFMGSGTTGIAATNLNYNFVGIEREREYYEICVNRIKNNIKSAEGLNVLE